MAEILYTQREAAAMLGYKHPRSLDRLIRAGELECVKRRGLRGQKLFSDKNIQDYINSLKI